MSLLRRHLPVLLFACAVLSLSGSRGSAGATGSWAEPLIMRVLGVTAETAEVVHHGIRKLGHFTAYGVFAWLAWRSIRGDRPATIRIAAWALLAAVLLASTDELLQLLAADRGASVFDVLLDSAGATTALVWLTRARRGGRAAA